MKDKKGNIIIKLIIIVIIIISVGVIGFLFVTKFQVSSQPTNKAADWQIYKDDKAQFQFKYPNNLILEKGDKIIIEKTGVQYLSFLREKGGKEFITIPIFYYESHPGNDLSYAEWKYFKDNSAKINTGKCDAETESFLKRGLFIKLNVCNVIKGDKYISLETDEFISFFNPQVRVNSYFTKENKEVRDKIISTLEFTN